ncbi:uricase / urate oxidase / nodulin 35 [Wolffia australiana]
MAEGIKLEQKHGKSRVRVARVWRNVNGGSSDVIVEWKVGISLLSDCLPAYASGDNSAIVATDTMKNTVYVKAKECSEVVAVEDFAIVLGKHFTSFYPQVSGAIIKIIEKPWERVVVDGRPHEHGFKLGSEKRTTKVTVKKCGSLEVESGLEEFALLKTTKSGFERFVRDKYTILPDTRERMLATEISAFWRYDLKSVAEISEKSISFSEIHSEVKNLLASTFFGPANGGVYSPSVQNTLFLMGKAVLNRFSRVASIHLRMPNIHFLPVNLRGRDNQIIVQFADDVYTPTDEPHGTIEATLTRASSKL